MNLLQTIISSLVTKMNYIIINIVILFPCYVFSFASKDFVFPFLRWGILDLKLERIYFNIRHNSFILNYKCAFIWSSYHFNALFILCYSSVSSVKKRNFTPKGKTMFNQAAWFFRILCQMDI